MRGYAPAAVVPTFGRNVPSSCSVRLVAAACSDAAVGCTNSPAPFCTATVGMPRRVAVARSVSTQMGP